MKELHLLKNLESDIVFVEELMGNFIGREWGGGGIVKKDCFLIFLDKKKKYMPQ